MNGESIQNQQKYGALTAFANALVGVAMLMIDFAYIIAMRDMMQYTSALWMVQGGLKLLSVATLGVLIVVLSKRIDPDWLPLLRVGPWFGFAAICLLLVHTCLSAITQTLYLGGGEQIHVIVDLLYKASIFLSGIWYLIENWAARQTKTLPMPLAILGLAIGVMSLVPPLEMVVAILSLIWLVWLGGVMWRGD